MSEVVAGRTRANARHTVTSTPTMLPSEALKLYSFFKLLVIPNQGSSLSHPTPSVSLQVAECCWRPRLKSSPHSGGSQKCPHKGRQQGREVAGKHVPKVS